MFHNHDEPATKEDMIEHRNSMLLITTICLTLFMVIIIFILSDLKERINRIEKKMDSKVLLYHSKGD